MKKNALRLVLGTCLTAIAIMTAGCQPPDGAGPAAGPPCPNPDRAGKDRFVEVFLDAAGKLAISDNDRVKDVWPNDILQWKRQKGLEQEIAKLQIVFEEKGDACKSTKAVVGANPCQNWPTNESGKTPTVNCKAKPDVGCPRGYTDPEPVDYCYSINGWDREGTQLPSLDPVVRGRR